MNKDAEIINIKEEKGDKEFKLIKNIEIVIDVIKRAADKVGKIGKRDWKEVFE
jgi:hypothetical protein